MADVLDTPKLTVGKKAKKPKLDRPYDSFVRLVTERPEVARDIICHRYTSSMTQDMKFDAMKLCQGTFVSEDYHRKETDVLFEVPCLDTSVYVYFLIEHWHEPDPMLAPRLFEYMLCIMRRYEKQNKQDKLPLVLPVVLYDGQKQWTHTTDIRKLIEGPEDIIKQVWNEPFRLIQASDITEDEIKEHRWSGTLTWIMANAQARDILEQLDNTIVRSILEQFDAQGGTAREFVVELMNHISYTNSSIEEGTLRAYVHQHFSSQVEEKMASLAQRIHDKGWDQGIQQGIQEGELKGDYKRAVATARKLLRRGGFDLKEIADISGLPLHEVELLTVE